MNTEIERDNITCFFCRELFALLIEKKLDHFREKQMSEHLSKCRSCAHSLDRIKKVLEFMGDLAGATPAPHLVEIIQKEHNPIREAMVKYRWQNWPSSLQWVVQLSVVAMTCIVLVYQLPWLNFAKSLKALRPLVPVATQQAEAPPKATDARVEVGQNQQPDAPGASDFGMTDGVTQTALPKTETENAQQIAQTVEQEEAPSEEEVRNEAAGGFVWRGKIKVDNLTDETANQLTSMISDLDGTKAGQVNLGWRKDNSRYYHFIVPEDNYEKLRAGMGKLGALQISKESHPRVIKKGFMRIILTLDGPVPAKVEEETKGETDETPQNVLPNPAPNSTPNPAPNEKPTTPEPPLDKETN